MTTIAAKVTNGKVKIAWDSQATAGGMATYGINKVVRINDQFAVGTAGHLRYANLIHRASVDRIHPFDLSQPEFDGYAWLLDEAVPAWMKSVKKELENLPGEAEKLDAPWGHALVALGGRIYTVGTDFSVMPVEEFTAIGSGGSFALTAMHLGKAPKQAVEIAAELDLFTGGRVQEMTV